MQFHFHANQIHFHANQSHFHKNSFALRLALKQRHRGTRKWPINLHQCYKINMRREIYVAYSYGKNKKNVHGFSGLSWFTSN